MISMKQKICNVCIILFPIALGVVAALLIIIMKVPAITLPRVEFILNAVISCATTISGFVITSVSILTGATSCEIMKEIKVQGGFTELQIRYTEALILGVIAIVYFIILGATIDETACISTLYISISAGILVAYGYSVISTGYYLLSIIGLLNKIKSIATTPTVPQGEFGTGDK